MKAFVNALAIRHHQAPRRDSVKFKFLCNLENGKSDDVSSPSRRRLLQALASAPLAAVELVRPGPTAARIVDRDRLYDVRSGSFVPVSAVGALLRRDVGKKFDRCIVAAEIHDNICTHAAQLAVIQHASQLPDGMQLTVGFEQFHRAHNHILDAFVQRRLGLSDMLNRTKWYTTTWGFDHKLYTPIFEYCRFHRIPMVGLNVPFEFVRQVSAYGFDGIPDALKEFLPDNMDLRNKEHYKHFIELMGWDGVNFAADDVHGGRKMQRLVERYYQAQVLWEEWMSQSVAMSLSQRPGTRMVALIGSGHVEGRYGFPDRIEKRCKQRPYTIVPRPVSWNFYSGLSVPDIPRPETDIADLVWYTRRKVDLV